MARTKANTELVATELLEQENDPMAALSVDTTGEVSSDETTWDNVSFTDPHVWRKQQSAERAETNRKLREKFSKSAVKQRSGGGGKELDYLEGHTVIDRLITATNNLWSFSILQSDVREWGTTSKGEQQYLVRDLVRLFIDGLGYRDAWGVQIVTQKSGEDMWKGAQTDGLKKAASLFGVGLELYGDILPPVRATDDSRLKEMLRAQGIKTKGDSNKAAQERFGVGYDTLTDAQIATWTSELEKSQPVPF
jgi:hypothetical protein